MVYSYTHCDARIARIAAAKDAASPQFASLREVRAYWDALRDDQDLPRREQMNPRGMAGALHQVFMLERVAPGVARFRLAGMDINSLMGMDVRGMPVSALFDPAARARLAELLEKVTATRAIVEMELEADRGIGRPALRARLLLLPLKGATGEPNLILGCLASEGQTGRAPRRFAIARASEAAIEAPNFVRSGFASDAPQSATHTTFAPRLAIQPAPERAEPAAPKSLPPKPKPERPYLRLVRLED